MKIKTTRTCAWPGCSKVFKRYNTIDKFCIEHQIEHAKQLEKKTQSKSKKGKPIKKESDKRRRESYLYSKKRKTFLAKPENLLCPVVKVIFNEDRQTSEIHHKAGRKGKLLNYVPYWLAVSREGHNWIHNNPKEAYKLGFLIRASTVNV